MTITFRVYGTPVPKGSMRAFVNRGKPVVVHQDAKGIGAWTQSIAAAALDARERADEPLPDGATEVTMVFFLPKPKSVRRKHPHKRPDLDKLVRTVLDALTGILFADDGQVVSLTAEKHYADRGEFPPGVLVRVGNGDYEKD